MKRFMIAMVFMAAATAAAYAQNIEVVGVVGEDICSTPE